MPAEEATLKCVIAWSDRRQLGGLVEEALAARVESAETVRLNDDSCVVHTSASVSDVRDWLVAGLQPGESLLVFEFERWSGYGTGVESNWLRRRGH